MSDLMRQQLLDEIDALKNELVRARCCDELTGLYNKRTYCDMVRKKLDNEPEEKYVLVCLDIEKFKLINDRFGFVEGDRLLQHIAEQLKKRTNDFGVLASRLSSDIFCFFDKSENIDTEPFGAEVQGWVKDYPLDYEIKIAVGVYRIDISNIPVRLMCDRANLAADTVKNNYMINAAEYNNTVRDFMIAQQELLNDAEKAFKNREFKVFLQPKFDIRTNKVIGAESLVRWKHPKRGLIYPKDFIPLFEQNMIITKLDEYIWEESCHLIREWIDKGYGEIPISVNVSRIDILLLDVPAKFVEFADKYKISRNLIEIEITESAFTNDEDHIIDIVDKIRSFGFKVLMDDFGSGYSSLNILKDINVDVLKIDTRFLESKKNNNNKGKEILESVIRMAKWIGLQTIAEGVETDEQRYFLMNQGCYYAQGFYFSKPISVEEFEDIIKNPENISVYLNEKEDDRTIAIEELFSSDFMTENLLNNILGGVVIYSFDGKDNLKLLKANEAYHEIVKNHSETSDNVLDNIRPEDRKMFIEAFREARRTGSKSILVQKYSPNSEEQAWFNARIFYLADKEDGGMYYASVSDATEQMAITNALDMTRLTFETALELIEAVVLEYNFKSKDMYVKTKLKKGNSYYIGETIENVLKVIVEKNIIHPGSLREYENFCKALMKTDNPLKCVLDLKQEDTIYKRCNITAKIIYKEKIPVKSIVVVESTGQIVN